MHGLRRERHEGRSRRRARARARARGTRPRTGRRRPPAVRARGAPAAAHPLPALFDASRAGPRGRPRGAARAHRPDDPGGVRRQPLRAGDFHGVSGHSARPWLADNALHRAIEGLARWPSRTARGGDRRPAVLRGRVGHPARRGHGRQLSPDRAVATSTCATRPIAPRPTRKRCSRSLVPTDAEVEVDGELAAGAVAVGRAARAGAPRRRAPDTSRSRRGRTSPTSRRAESPPSTSDRARPGTPTAGRAGRDRRARARVRRASRSRSAIALSSNFRACRSPPSSARPGHVPVRPA